jgi:hypothetical protein
MALNVAVNEIDAHVQTFADAAHLQMAVLMLAQVKAFRRVLDAAGPMNRGRRHKVMNMAVQDFRAKLTQYAVDRVQAAPAADTDS